MEYTSAYVNQQTRCSDSMDVDHDTSSSTTVYPIISVRDVGDSIAETSEGPPCNPMPSDAYEGTNPTSSNQMQDFQATREAMREAMEYLILVKQRFAFRDDLYQEFSSILRAIHQPPVDQVQLSRRISDLFQDSPDLLSGLEKFIPREIVDLESIIVGEKMKSMNIHETSETV